MKIFTWSAKSIIIVWDLAIHVNAVKLQSKLRVSSFCFRLERIDITIIKPLQRYFVFDFSYIDHHEMRQIHNDNMFFSSRGVLGSISVFKTGIVIIFFRNYIWLIGVCVSKTFAV